MSREWSKEADACDEFVLSAYENYSIDTVAELLLPTGLLIDKSTEYAGSFDKYIFLNGNKDEIYTKQEIEFISSVGDIEVFAEFHKKNTELGIIPCRVIAARNSKMDPVDFSIAFIKINNKAIDSFNICIIFSEEGIIIACRSYYDSLYNGYHISNIIKTESQMKELYDTFMDSPEYKEFISYYLYVSDCIQYKVDTVDYLSKKKSYNRRAYGYTDEDWAIENKRSLWEIGERHKVNYADRVAESDEYLFKIESSQMNTMEMLIEAEETDKSTSESARRNEKMIMQSGVEADISSEEIDAEIKAVLDDPELMIKLLKKKRGI